MRIKNPRLVISLGITLSFLALDRRLMRKAIPPARRFTLVIGRRTGGMLSRMQLGMAAAG